MNHSRPSPRLATPDDFRRFFGRDPPAVWFGLVAEKDGEILGVGIVQWDEWGRAWGSVDAAAKVSPIVLHRAARSAIDTLTKVGEPVIYAFCNTAVPHAAAWLARLGFAPDAALSTGEPQVWSRRLADG